MKTQTDRFTEKLFSPATTSPLSPFSSLTSRVRTRIRYIRQPVLARCNFSLYTRPERRYLHPNHVRNVPRGELRGRRGRFDCRNKERRRGKREREREVGEFFLRQFLSFMPYFTSRASEEEEEEGNKKFNTRKQELV